MSLAAESARLRRSIGMLGCVRSDKEYAPCSCMKGSDGLSSTAGLDTDFCRLGFGIANEDDRASPAPAKELLLLPINDLSCSLNSRGAADRTLATASLKQRLQVQIALAPLPDSALLARLPSRSPSCVVTKLYGKLPNTNVMKYGLTGILSTPHAILSTLYGSRGKRRARRR